MSLDMKKGKVKVRRCPVCNGAGRFITDFYDPRDYHGHGQTEEPCERCMGTGEIVD